jgi:hypothetical protein
LFRMGKEIGIVGKSKEFKMIGKKSAKFTSG